MDENWLKRTFAPTQALVSCKVIRHKTTQMSRGYGFLLFNSHEAANFVLTQLNGKLIPGTDQVFRLNWAANGRQGIAGPSDYSLFVGDLTEEVTDYMLQEAFRRYYPSVRSAKVMRAPLSGRSRNFGFCRFANEQERDRALVEMNSHEICGRPVRVSLATARKTQSSVSLDVPTQDNLASATLFVGGLTDKLTEEDLRGMFSLYGDLISVKCLASKGCAFVQYTSTAAAKAAMTMLQDQVVAGSPIRISWGRQNTASRPAQQGYANPTSSYTYPGSIVPGSTFGAESYTDALSVPSLSGLASNQQVLPSGAFNPLGASADPSSYSRPGSYGPQGLALQARPELTGMPEAPSMEQMFGNLSLQNAAGSSQRHYL